jgi:hypothetical protein
MKNTLKYLDKLLNGAEVQWKTIGEQELLVQHSVRNVTLGKKNGAEVQWKTLGEQEFLVQHSVRNVTLGKKNKITIKLHSIRNAS